MFRKITLFFLIAIFALPFTTIAAEPDSKPVMVLTLEKSLELAYSNSQSLKAASQKVVIARADMKKAEAAFRPTVEYSLGLVKYNEELASTQSDRIASGNVTASWPIYTGKKQELQLQIAKAQLNLALESEREIKQQLTYDVQEAYYRIWVAEEMLKVSKASYNNMDQHVAKVEKLFKVGTTSKFDVLKAEVQREGLKPQVIKNENSITYAKLAFTTLIGLDKDTVFTIIPANTKIKPEKFQATSELSAFAFANRTELKQLTIQNEIADYQVQLAKSVYKPNIELSGGYGFESPDWSPGDWDPKLNLTLGIKGNFYSPTAKPNTAATQGQVELIAIQEKGLKDRIHLEVEQALQTICESTETTKSNQANIELAREALRMTQSRFDAGMATTMDVMDAQLDLDKALIGYYQGISDYLIARCKLDLVTGKAL